MLMKSLPDLKKDPIKELQDKIMDELRELHKPKRDEKLDQTEDIKIQKESDIAQPEEEPKEEPLIPIPPN